MSLPSSQARVGSETARSNQPPPTLGNGIGVTDATRLTHVFVDMCHHQSEVNNTLTMTFRGEGREYFLLQVSETPDGPVVNVNFNKRDGFRSNDLSMKAKPGFLRIIDSQQHTEQMRFNAFFETAVRGWSAKRHRIDPPLTEAIPPAKTIEDHVVGISKRMDVLRELTDHVMGILMAVDGADLMSVATAWHTSDPVDMTKHYFTFLQESKPYVMCLTSHNTETRLGNCFLEVNVYSTGVIPLAVGPSFGMIKMDTAAGQDAWRIIQASDCARQSNNGLYIPTRQILGLLASCTSEANRTYAVLRPFIIPTGPIPDRDDTVEGHGIKASYFYHTDGTHSGRSFFINLHRHLTTPHVVAELPSLLPELEPGLSDAVMDWGLKVSQDYGVGN